MRLSKKGWVILTTLIVIALVFTFYFLVYVKNKEYQIISDKMQVLSQVKSNIELLINSEKKVRENKKTEVQNPAKRKLTKAFPGWTISDQNTLTQGFIWGKDSATWMMGKNLAYRKPYADFFCKDLIERKDVFEFIVIGLSGENKVSTLFSNHPLGKINLPSDSTLAMINHKNVFEIDLGSDQYVVFSSLLKDQEPHQVYLLGFVNKSQYNEDKREVSVFFVTVAIILVILIILALPLIKLQIMSNAERLRARDVILAGLSLVLGPALMILFFLFFTVNIFTGKGREEFKLEMLHQKLSANFKDEMTNVVQQLNYIKQKLPPNFTLNDTSLVKKLPFFKDLSSGQHFNYFTDVWKYDSLKNNFRYFNSIFWTDSIGNIKIYLSSEKSPNVIGSLQHRTYVSDIVKDKAVKLNQNEIAFESIRSVSDGNYEMGLGISSGNTSLPVLATSFSMASLMDPILEDGYGFCLINETGLTLFHSETKRNLNDDFLKETDEVFNPYLKSGIGHFASTQYMGKEHYMYLHKVPNLEGYYLATFLDKAYTYSPNAIALNMTAEMQVTFLLIMSLVYLILFYSSGTRKKIKQNIFLFYWLRPILFTKEHRFIYVKLLLIHLLVLLYLVWNVLIYRYVVFSPELIVHSLLCAGTFVIVSNFWILSVALPEKERMYTLFNALYSPKTLWFVVGAFALLLLVGRILILKEIPLFYGLGEAISIGLMIFGLFLITKWYEKGSHYAADNLNGPVFNNHSFVEYKLYVCSIILFFSIIPVLVFFSINYKMEQEILFKQEMFLLKERIDNWNTLKAAQFYKNHDASPIIDSLDQFVQNMAYDSLNYVLPYNLRIKKSDTPHASDLNDRLFTEMYEKARVEFDDYGVRSQGFIYSNPDAGKSWSFSGTNMYFPDQSPSWMMAGPIDRFTSVVLYNWWRVAIFFPLLILLIYILVNSFIYKAFGVGFKEYADKLVLPKDYQKIARMLASVYSQSDGQRDCFNNSFIVGVNASHVYEIFHYLKKWKADGFYSIELMDLPRLTQAYDGAPSVHPDHYFSNSYLDFQVAVDKLVKSSHNQHDLLFKVLDNKHIRQDSSPIMVYIEHFEFAYDNERLNKIKLNILQRLVSNPSIRIVISSEISPTKIYEFYEDNIKRAMAITISGSEKTLANSDKVNMLKSEYRQWQHLLGGFYRITVPIEYQEAATNTSFLEKELEHGHYLHRINHKYKILYKNIHYCEDLILNIQETSYTYYYAIWNSLTKEERYIIYDIAHDQFLNTNNVDGIIDLLHKGILVYDYSLHLMNESFTNFVLTKVDSDDALERELAHTKGGSWSTASAVLMLVIISLIIFISFGKINILQDVNALLGSLAAIIALLLRVGGIFITGKPARE